ncbi:MAG: hypothetical protein HY525_14360 [Betaproteobacteria bacterium]|nr:hypothetical protein [Betaproteobacteria bacterium]
MSHPTAYHQLGRFIVGFQHLENAVTKLLVLLDDTDSEAVLILVNELAYNQRLRTADVLFSRFVDLRKNTDPASKAAFHDLMVELGKLGQRRNELVHSRYNDWINIEGRLGLLRKNSRLSAKKGEREELEEELQPEAFDGDLQRLGLAATELERFRLQVIDWLYPDDGT